MVRDPSGVLDYAQTDRLCLGQIFSFKLGTRTVIGAVNTYYFVSWTLRCQSPE